MGATFLTSRHILVLKAHSIEVCTLLDLDDARQEEAPAGPRDDNVTNYITRLTHPSERYMRTIVHSHYLPSTTLRGASFARPTLHSAIHHSNAAWHHSEPTKVSTSFLAFDVLRGLFHFSVSVTLPPAYAELQTSREPEVLIPLDVHIDLLSSHNMAVPISNYLVHKNGTSTPSAIAGNASQSDFSDGTRGFVSSCALGPTGRRGVWVERRRGEVRRVVYGFRATVTTPEQTQSTATVASSTEDPLSVVESTSALLERAEAMRGHEVYEVNSYDLGGECIFKLRQSSAHTPSTHEACASDDITHIAFAEATGIIALGTRKGDIRVLGRV